MPTTGRPGPVLRRATATRPTLTARLLGPMMVTLDGRVVDTASSRRTRHVLAYLLLHRRSAVPRDVLMDTFWPDARPAAARNSLHVALTGVRRVAGRGLARPVLERRHGGYRLAGDVDVWVDVDEFERLRRDGPPRRPGRRPAPRRWPPTRRPTGSTRATCWPRTRTRTGPTWPGRRCGSTCSTCSAGWPSCTPPPATTPPRCWWPAGRWHVDPCNEPLHRQLMRSYRDTDQVHLALTQYHRCAEALWREHRVRPGRGDGRAA